MNIGGWVLSFPQPQPAPWLSISRVGPKPTHFLAIALSLRLSRLSSRSRLCTSFQDVWSIRAFRFPEFDLVKWSKDAFSTTSSLFLFDGNQTGKDASVGSGISSSDRSNQTPYRRQWTNALLAANVLLFIAQIATQGKMMLWGAKINNLISEGQLWRLVTSSFLHANIGHLMVNCYSLNSVGPAVETFSGPQRFFAIYFTSAVASTAMSYWLCKAPAVGASGAIFGLVGSVAVFVMRHRGMVGRGTEDLQHIAHVIIINMVIGGLSRGIDNWGHLGGLLGGVAMSWLLGPAWQYEANTRDGRKIFSDRAPISRLRNFKKPPWLR